ncbi:MAG: hypothetical protein L0H84_01690 [Pseudonocardia sp.]|nr:hypothetical protein [Pseudonocardia sp.]
MSVPTNVRFPEAVDEGLARFARQTGAPKSTVVVGAVREWLRMQAHPGIVFVTDLDGERRAALAVGPQVWTVAESWLQHDATTRTPMAVADTLGLTLVDVEAALAYWAEFREEIDAVLNRHRAAQDAALAAWERRRALDGL